MTRLWSVELFDRGGNRVRAEQLTLAPRWYAATAVGGPEAAEVAVSGPADALWQVADWLHYRLVIRNAQGTCVWWGFVERATVGMGSVQVGLTLENVANRVSVAYTYEDASGSAERGTTEWAQDNLSVATYGRFEARLTLADAEEGEALAYRATELGRRAFPQPVTELNDQTGALLSCAGWWSTLRREFYADDRGVVENKVTANLEQVIGWKLGPTNRVGFKWDRVDDLDARLAAVRAGNSLRVVGSLFNDGLYTVKSPPEEGATAVVYTSNDIYFEAQDDIKDPSDGLGWARLNHMVKPSGSAQSENNTTRWVTKLSGLGAIEMEPGGIVTETQVGAITLQMGHGLTCAFADGAAFAQEVDGASDTLYHGSYKVAQRFRIPSALGWQAREIRVQVAKVGSPADNVRAALWWGSDVEPVGSLVSAQVTSASVPTDMTWVTFDLGAGTALAAATDYWLVVDRVGAPSTTDFYLVGLAEAEGDEVYEYGLKVYDGHTSTWAARAHDDTIPDARMPFRVLGRTATSEQLRDMLEAAQWASAVKVRTASGVESLQFRDGEQTLATEAERLLEMGVDGGGRLLAHFEADRVAVVEGAPVSGPLNLRMDSGGRLRQAMGQRLEEGVLPVRAWVGVDGAPAGLSAAATFFVERAQYDLEQERLTVEPQERVYE